IDLLIQSINKTNDKIKSALLLMLTSASGQMSKMVFAITNRGKNNGTPSKIDIEVGSWAIGYWKPKLHFEINVWNCFDNKVQKLLKTLKYQDTNNYTQVDDLNTFWDSKSDLCLIENDCKKILNNIPDDTIELIITDPPHGDRIPYLELSSLWNALLHKKPDYVSEIVVSNAKEREKNIASYNLDMKSVLCNMIRILKPQGILALIFNAVDKKYWEFLTDIDLKSKGTTYLGCFPLNYSANSLVQDNRQGALKHDYVLIFRKVQNHDNTDAMSVFNKIQGWSINFPLPLGEEK
ncbi:MAG: type II modification methylase, partial [Tissierellia bacterium]|nr:type II modification methylase [Tissierellia bacterium]